MHYRVGYRGGHCGRRIPVVASTRTSEAKEDLFDHCQLTKFQMVTAVLTFVSWYLCAHRGSHAHYVSG